MLSAIWPIGEASALSSAARASCMRMRPEFAHRLRGDVAAADAFLGQEFELGASLTQCFLRHDGAGLVGRQIPLSG